jgi:hypothetical protein
MPKKRSRSRTRVGGNSDPYNSNDVRENLRGYTRVSIPQVCGDPISRDDLKVWINHTGKWVNFDTSKLWQKKGPSLCRQLVNELGMSSAQYDSLRDVFDDVHSTDLVGLYQKGSKYVIVLRVPQTSIYDKLVVGGAAGGGAVAGALTSWAARRNWTQKAKWIETFKEYISNNYQLYAIEEQDVPIDFDTLNTIMGELMSAQGNPELEQTYGRRMIKHLKKPELANFTLEESVAGPRELQIARKIVDQYTFLIENSQWTKITETGELSPIEKIELTDKEVWLNNVYALVLSSMELERLINGWHSDLSGNFNDLKLLTYELMLFDEMKKDHFLTKATKTEMRKKYKVVASKIQIEISKALELAARHDNDQTPAIKHAVEKIFNAEQLINNNSVWLRNKNQ